MNLCEETMNPVMNYLSQHEPAVYRICVAGCLPEEWEEQFGEMDTEEVYLPGGLVTFFTASVPDQAGLHGLLHQLRDFGLPLVGLELVSSGTSA
jgi:hypothetical protein